MTSIVKGLPAHRIQHSPPSPPRSVGSGVRYAAIFFATLLLLVFSYTALVVLVNPQGDFPTKLFPAVRSDYRREKIDRFLAYQREAPVTGVIIGSSRSMLLSPRRLDQLFHLRFFNFGVASAMGEDDLAILRWVRRHGARPKLIVLGIDMESLSDFHSSLAPRSSVLNLAQVGGPQEPLREKLQQSWGRYLSWSYARDTIYSIWLKLRSQPPIVEIGPDGVLKYVMLDARRRAGTFSIQLGLARCLAQCKEKVDSTNALSPERMSYVEHTVSEARQGGANVILWVTGPSPFLASTLERTSRYPEFIHQTRSFMYKLASHYQVRALDFSEEWRFEGAPDGWYDCNHFDDSNARKIEQLMAQGSP